MRVSWTLNPVQRRIEVYRTTGRIATLEGNIVDPVVQRTQSPIDDAQRVRYSFLDEEKGSAVAP